MKIRKATSEDAPFIAEGIMTAVGREICLDFAEGEQNLYKLREMFTGLAAREDSQYSYLNTLLAVDEDSGHPLGVIISYDGADLVPLREAFFEEAWNFLGKKLNKENFPPETDESEIYIDTLMVLPEFRKQGIAYALIREVRKNGFEKGKPLGLIVDYDNPDAKRLYTSLGFEHVGERPFADTMMEHLQWKDKSL